MTYMQYRKINIHRLTSIISIVILAGFFLLSSVLYVQGWSAAPTNPPGSNTSAPINIGGVYQVKSGDLGVGRIRGGGVCNASANSCMIIDRHSSFIAGSGNNRPVLRVGGANTSGSQRGQVWADQFCDLNGGNCSNPANFLTNTIDIGVSNTRVTGNFVSPIQYNDGTRNTHCPSGYVMTGMRVETRSICGSCRSAVYGIAPRCTLACIDQRWDTGAWSSWSSWREVSNTSIGRVCERTRSRTVTCTASSCTNACRPLASDVQTQMAAGSATCSSL